MSESADKPYAEYEGNEFVESMGGRDLLADSPHMTNPYADEQPLDVASVEEQRRAASLQSAQSLGINDVDNLLSAAKKIENYLKGENLDA